MNTLGLFAGNACFMVKESDKKLKEEFEQYILDEGFKSSQYMSARSLNIFYINVNSMLYATGVHYPVKLTATIVDENPQKALTVDEFKTIWNIIKNKRKNLTIENEDSSLIRSGSSCFLVKDEKLENPNNDFWMYLIDEKFELINGDISSGKFALINVSTMIYQKGFNKKLHSPFVGDSFDTVFSIDSLIEDKLTNYISIDEFKTIWNIVKKYKEDEFNVDNMVDECESFYHQKEYSKALEICDRILKLDESNEKALEFKSSIHFETKMYKQALECVNKAIHLYPNNYKFFNIKAFILTDSYNYIGAFECYNRSFSLGGFDEDDTVRKYRSKCFLVKTKDDYYIKKDKDEALKSLKIYHNDFPEDDDVSLLKQELTGKYPFRYTKQLIYFETKAKKLFESGLLRESFESYKDVLNASAALKDNLSNISYIGYNLITKRTVYELDNFRWYNEHLSICLLDFMGDYEEFFKRLYEMSSDTFELCFDKLKLLSKISDEKTTYNYLCKLLSEFPENEELMKFHDTLAFNIMMGSVSYRNSGDYNSFREYVEDVLLSLMCSTLNPDSKRAIQGVRRHIDDIRSSYEGQYDAGEMIYDYWFDW